MPSRGFTFAKLQRAIRQVVRHDQLVLSILALLIGIGVGGAVIGFREAIGFIQYLFYSTDSERLFLFVAGKPWWLFLGAPALGGLIVGLLIHFFLPERRPHAVADVIEAYARRNAYMSSRVGLMAALTSAISIGCGASVGREGPAVHLGASLAGWITRRLHLSRTLARTILGSGVAAAVAASFNAPIAGALFASEVVIGHYALRSFAPIVIASVAGTAVSRAWFGDFPAFVVVDTLFASFWEFPAFVLLGIVSGIAALVFMHSIRLSTALADRLPGPRWYRPAIAGLAVGAIALLYPQVLGVGYGTTEAVMTVQYTFWTVVAIGVAKLAATAISLGFGFAGGVFSPSLVLGALTGSAFGILATYAFPGLSSGADAYALVGMGAVAAAVLGAPISTTLIVFELTGDYALTLGVMIAVVIASEITLHLYGRSFFTVQLKERGIDLRGEFEAEALHSQRVGRVMEKMSSGVPDDRRLPEIRDRLQHSRLGELFVVDGKGILVGTITLADLQEQAFDSAADEDTVARDVCRRHPPVLTVEDDLGTALSVMNDSGEDHIAVVDDMEAMRFVGCVHHRDVMTAYNRALAQSRHQEHND